MSKWSLRGSILALLIVSGSSISWITQGLARPDDSPARQPWTSSRVVGQPDRPPPYKTPVSFPNLKFDHPLVMVSAPGSDRLFVGEQAGKIFSFVNRPDARAELFVDLSKELKRMGEHPDAKGFEALYGLVFHPKFEQNREVFICYTMRGKPGKTGPFDHERNLPNGSRVSRFQVTQDNPPRLAPGSEEILLTYVQGGHNGGDLHFGPDGYLYISTGDATSPNPPDVFRTGQDITDLESSVLRIDVDHKDPGKNYAIPKDNPFVTTQIAGKPARPEVWAYGFRNPWRMSFDRATGDLWLGDVGWERWEMVHKIEKGGNYGWSVVEARQPINHTWPVGPTPIRAPAIELDHAIAASVTGGYVYRGKKHPELVGKYIFGDWETRRFWAAKFEGDRLLSLEELTDPRVRVVSFGQDLDGEIHFLDYDNGTVHTLVPNETPFDPTGFPRLLSTTGLFASVKDHTPARGVYPFEVSAPLWSDGAVATRWVALPGDSSVVDHEEPKPVPGDVHWHKFKYHFPKGTVLLKTLEFPEKKQRVETQLLHFDGENWRGYSYAWRDDQTDAELVEADGSEKIIPVSDPRVPGGKRELHWIFHSRQQCSQCHHAWSEYANGFNTLQLNRKVTVDGHPVQQLTHLGQLGLLTRVDKKGKPLANYDQQVLSKQPKLADPADAKARLPDRARAYLHANCGHCHRNGGGGTVSFELHAEGFASIQKLIDAKPTRGDFELKDPRIIAPGEPERSVIYYRMAKFGGGRMPHLGSDLVDAEGVSLMHDWIRSLKASPARTQLADLSAPTPALALVRELINPDCPNEKRQQILSQAATLPTGNVRDLFEGYLPTDGKPRKLGTNPRPRSILMLTGQASKGKELFLAQRSQCLSCHKIDGQGNEIGPDLTKLESSKNREYLLESLLDPSRRVDAPYQSFVLRTLSGQVVTGLVVQRSEKQIVMKDAQNKTITVLADDVESLTVSRTSLMPDGLLRDFTAQEAADLLAYLLSLRR